MYRTAAADNLRAKTGTIEGVSALSGMVRSRDGERLAFSLIVNDSPSQTRAKRVENQIGTRLAEFRRSPGQVPVVVAEAPEPTRRATAFADRHRVASGENLSAIGGDAERGGAQVILVTAPGSHERLGVPDYLVEEGFAASKEAVLDRHRHYNEIVRSLARERGWHLLDLQAALGEIDDLGQAFQADGIHLTPWGRRWVATKLAEVIITEVLGDE